MTQGERVKEIRRSLKLTLEKFGERLGVGKTAISKIEKGENNLSSQMMKAICNEYRVNYEYLESGVGEMFSDVPQTVVDELCEQYDLDDFDRIMLQEYLKMDEASRNVLKTYIRKICGQISEVDDTQTTRRRRSTLKSKRTVKNWNLKQDRRTNHQLPTRLPKIWHKNKPVKVTGWKDGHYGII